MATFVITGLQTFAFVCVLGRPSKQTIGLYDCLIIKVSGHSSYFVFSVLQRKQNKTRTVTFEDSFALLVPACS